MASDRVREVHDHVPDTDSVMKLVVFTKEYRDDVRERLYMPGSLAQFSDEEAERLVRAGFARVREPFGPTETKGEIW